MQEWVDLTDDIGPERVFHVYDPRVGMKGVVVVDSTIRGRAGGGTRMLPDITTEEMLGLGRAMTHKFAILGIPIGGAKAGIWADPGMKGDKRKEILKAFGNAIKPLLENRVGIGADIGTDNDDVAMIYEGAGLSSGYTGLSLEEIDGEPLENHATGYGVVVAAKAACEFAGIEIQGATVAIEGFGKVGGGVARYMMEEGAKVVAISTIEGAIYDEGGLDVKKIIEMRKDFGDKVVQKYPSVKQIDKRALFSLPVDILIPGARPYVINGENVHGIQAKIISSVANIPITNEAEDILSQRGIISVPDFISNAGGVVLGMIDNLGGTVDHVFNALRTLIGPLTKDILTEAGKERINPRSLAVRKTREKFLKARAGEDSGIPPGERRKHLKNLFNMP